MLMKKESLLGMKILFIRLGGKAIKTLFELEGSKYCKDVSDIPIS
jgi:hypothetical protein